MLNDPAPSPGEFDALERHLLSQAERCVRPPIDRFRHPWFAPMPLSPAAEAYLAQRAGKSSEAKFARRLAVPAAGDGFTAGDYSLGLFSHDACEAAPELVQHEKLLPAAAGSLLCLLENALPNGRVNRTELPHKTRDDEPAKPILAQLALQVMEKLGEEWAEKHRLFDRLQANLQFVERHYTGMHGLILTHSSRASGFDSDIYSADLPDKAVEAPDTNTFWVLECRAFAEIAKKLGKDADYWLERAEHTQNSIEQLLWHEGAGHYVALRFVHGAATLEAETLSGRDASGTVTPLESWVSYLPLYAGIPRPDRADRMIARLLDPEAFWSDHGFRTMAKSDPFFHQAPRVMLFDPTSARRGPVSNWTGPIWILSSHYLARGLAQYGRKDAAKKVALRTARLLAGALVKEGRLHECYDDQGRGLWPRRGTFVSWNVLALTMLREHVAATNPRA